MSDDVKPGDAIAVYGLLRKGAAAFARFGLDRAFTPLGPCRLRGRLYDLGDYPGLVEGGGEVVGELYEVRDVSVMPALDAFEDYHPGDRARSRYARVRVRLIAPERQAWTYLWRLGV